jgi:hypothetical protein
MALQNLIIFAVFSSVNAIYIPGLVPHEYNSRDKLTVLLSGLLTSSGKHHFSSDVDGKLKISEN